MQLDEFRYNGDINYSYLRHEEVLSYIHSYADAYNLWPYIKVNKNISLIYTFIWIFELFIVWRIKYVPTYLEHGKNSFERSAERQHLVFKMVTNCYMKVLRNCVEII